jgi:hypothetical protein
MAAVLNANVFQSESRSFRGSGGDSANNRGAGFEPAFLDSATGKVYRSRDRQGRPAPCHLLDGLPAEVVIKRSTSGHVLSVKRTVIAGFVRCGRFYTREEAVLALTASA